MMERVFPSLGVVWVVVAIIVAQLLLVRDVGPLLSDVNRGESGLNAEN